MLQGNSENPCMRLCQGASCRRISFSKLPHAGEVANAVIHPRNIRSPSRNAKEKASQLIIPASPDGSLWDPQCGKREGRGREGGREHGDGWREARAKWLLILQLRFRD